MNDHLTAVIVDDEPPGRDLVAGMLAADPDVEVVAQCASAEEGREAVRSLAPDLLLLDIEMPRGNGFSLLDGLDGLDGPSGSSRPRIPVVVFVTAFDRFALRAFEVHAVEFLVKPFSEERFAKALHHAKAHALTRRLYRRNPRMNRLFRFWQYELADAADRSAPRADCVEQLYVDAGGAKVAVQVRAVLWFRSADHYVELHTRGQTHLWLGTLSGLERKLDPTRFVRIHRGTIVNRSAVAKVSSRGGYHVLMQDGSRLKVSQTYKDLVPDLARATRPTPPTTP